MTYDENKPRPQISCFSKNQNFLKESDKVLPKEHSREVGLKSWECFLGFFFFFLRKDFQRFRFMPYWENKPRPQIPLFSRNQNFLTESDKGLPKEHSREAGLKSRE